VSVSVPHIAPAFALHVLPHSGADRLARLAARACDATIAVVVAVEEGQAVFHAGTGFSPQEREGLVALCEATLETPPHQPPLPARCAPDICFYRGLPLSREDGTPLGVLAVMDRAARGLSPEQEEDLETLAGLAAAQLDARHGRALQAMQHTEEDAQRLATRLGITLESITEGFYTLDPQWRFSYLNREGARLLGRPPTELLGKSIWKEFPGAINTLFSEQVRAAVAGNYQVEFEALYAPLDKWFEIRAYPFPDGLAIYFRDVSDRRQAREQLMLLETSISRLNDIVLIAEAVPSGKPGLRIIFANNAFEQHTGYSLEEAMGQSPRLLCGPLTQRNELERLRNAFQKWRAGAGRTHHLQKERTAFLDGSRHRAGGRRRRRFRHALGGGGARHHRAQDRRGKDPAPGLLRPADPAAEPAAPAGPAEQGAGRQPPARARAR
jgi:PAS domain-containing protein